VTDLKGAVLERYYYSPYGELEVVANSYFGDYNGDGFVNATDAASLCSSGCTCSYGTATGDCRVFDFDADGDLDATDQQTLASLYTGRSVDLQNRRIPSTSASPLGNPFALQGLVLDPEIHSYQNRARQYNPALKRFMQRDPLTLRPVAAYATKRQVKSGYKDGLNVYGYLRCSPARRHDPMGLETPTRGLCDAVIESFGGGVTFCVCLACGAASHGYVTASATAMLNQWAEWESAKGTLTMCRLDAMQHCIGAFMAANECGGACALCLGELLELRQGDGDAMDYDNNQAGVECEAQLTTPISCCEQKLDSGELNTSGNCE
jgi:RHS repeat-associated protein